MQLHIKTPTIFSASMSEMSGQQIWLKMECFQPALSFKIRGIGRLCTYYHEQGYQRLVASSGGNAGYCAAFAAKQLQLPLDVYVPGNTHPIYLEKIRRLGASVIVAGAVWDDAHQAALEAATQLQAAYVPPFDHPLIWAGNSTMVDEWTQQMPKPEAIVVAVGGGGLATGVLEGLIRHGWLDIPLWGVETAGAASLAASLTAGKMVYLPEIKTIATTLGTKHVCRRLLDLAQNYPVQAIQVSDTQAVHACQRFLDDQQVLVEPACGAALAAVYDQHPALLAYRSILIVVCGGVGISWSLLQSFQ